MEIAIAKSIILRAQSQSFIATDIARVAPHGGVLRSGPEKNEAACRKSPIDVEPQLWQIDALRRSVGQAKGVSVMRLQVVLLLCLIGASGVAFAEGGCPQGMTPVNNGQNWTCIPGGNDAGNGQAQQNAPPRPTGWWEKTWGAIAPSPKGGVLGTAVGASSKDEAERLALADCEAKGGGACKVQVAYHNQCGVMVLGTNELFTARAGSIKDVEDQGLNYCRKHDTNCRVYYSACTEPVFHRY